jgi:Flp pilus assembly protein CpaB
MHKRSNMLLALGAAVFLIGAALVVGVLQNTNKDESPGSGSVLVARASIPAGTSGADVIAKDLLVARNVPTDMRASDALVSTAELSGRVLDVEVKAGEQLRASYLRPINARGGAIKIPAGMQGVAIDVPFVSGGAGYIGAGDYVDIYGNVKGVGGRDALTKLVLGGVKVLDVSTEVAPRVVSGATRERVGANNVTYLLALDAQQAERVIYLAANQELWLTLQGEGNPPVPATPGRSSADVFK